ncbi:MAG: excinuclease ABC subunit UvrA [Blastochloris sp.]|nr:excinuclease ABC subunit UvrA [Blastochloris sp.]
MSQEPQFIRITGARQHNLKNISVALPRNQLVVITGPSGSGKSSLAFDTLFAEGQRRYMQSLSSYARQFLEQIEKPDVDFIEGLSPSVAIEQQSSNSNPRSTIATVTEIYDYLRVLYASCGQPHHPVSGKMLRKRSLQEIADQVVDQPASDRFMILAPMVQKQKGEFRDVLEKCQKDGYLRVRIDGAVYTLDQPIKLDPKKAHTIEVVVDRLKASSTSKTRAAESIELGIKVGDGLIRVVWLGVEDDVVAEWVMSNQNYDPETGYHFPVLEARHFSFNSPLGACPACGGTGTLLLPDADLIITDTEMPLEEMPFGPWRRAPKRMAGYYKNYLQDLADHAGVSMRSTWKELPTSFHKLIMEGSAGQDILFNSLKAGTKVKQSKPFEGLLHFVQNLYDASDSPLTRHRMAAFMSKSTCPVCQGKRLKKEVLAVTLGSKEDGAAPNIDDFCRWTVDEALAFLDAKKWSAEETPIVKELIAEICARLKFMQEVGLGYLTLNREAGTLSGGESQRIRLATQIGSGLSGVLYVLDEPSIGLHQRDNERLITTLERLRDMGNSVVVVEHDEDTMRRADYVVDMGPAAGVRGGEIVAEGTLQELLDHPKSLTGRYLSERLKIDVPRRRHAPKNEWLSVVGARENNLKNVTARFPIGCFTCVTGVSGSGKSTLVSDVLSRALFRSFYQAKERPGLHDRIEGLEHLDKVVTIDQSAIGRTPRSNPATYVGAFDAIRDLYAQLPASRIRGYAKGRFSFNVPGGRCEHCEGDGYKKIEMHFLPDVYVPCEVCKGQRFNRETLEVTFKSKNIADILALTVHEALDLFQSIPAIFGKLEPLAQVGLGYLTLGQSATTLSGGEAQRVKLAAELTKKATGRTCYIMDEPTTGLHFVDIEELLRVLFKLRDQGNTIIVIEHHLDVIKSADYVIDIGPEGGEKGGQIVTCGTPEAVAQFEGSHTGRFLLRKL